MDEYSLDAPVPVEFAVRFDKLEAIEDKVVLTVVSAWSLSVIIVASLLAAALAAAMMRERLSLFLPGVLDLRLAVSLFLLVPMVSLVPLKVEPGVWLAVEVIRSVRWSLETRLRPGVIGAWVSWLLTSFRFCLSASGVAGLLPNLELNLEKRF